MIQFAGDCVKFRGLYTLKTESHHDTSFVVIGGNGGYHNDSVQCHQWQQSWYHDNSNDKTGIMTTLGLQCLHWKPRVVMMPTLLSPVAPDVVVLGTRRCHNDKRSLQSWRHNERDGVSNRQRFDCLLNRLFMRRSKKTSKLRAIGLGEGNSPVTGEFPTQRASNAENVSIWWRHHGSAVSPPITSLPSTSAQETIERPMNQSRSTPAAVSISSAALISSELKAAVSTFTRSPPIDWQWILGW